MTEDEIVAAIRAIVEYEPDGSRHRRNSRVYLGIGDDAALWQPSRSHRSAISTDMLVEGVHFTRSTMSLEDAGWRAMAANLSDLAAMGARPVLATVALGVPRAAAFDELVSLYRGLAAAAKHGRVDIVGGDLTAGDVLTVAITVVGEVRRSNALTRSGGRPGDVLAVTGPLGAARAGLAVASAQASLESPLADAALDAFRRPQARLAEGRFLGANAAVRAMIDCSDGLSTDLHRLCAASGCGAELESVPVADAAAAVAREQGEQAERFALAGGEDFELLVAVRERAFPHVAARYAARFGKELLRVGVLRSEAGVLWGGQALARTGWDHFSAG